MTPTIRKGEVGRAAPGSAARTQGPPLHTHQPGPDDRGGKGVLTEIFHQEGEEAWVGRQEEGFVMQVRPGPIRPPQPPARRGPSVPGSLSSSSQPLFIFPRSGLSAPCPGPANPAPPPTGSAHRTRGSSAPHRQRAAPRHSPAPDVQRHHYTTSLTRSWPSAYGTAGTGARARAPRQGCARAEGGSGARPLARGR